jgi:hypothetical protein
MTVSSQPLAHTYKKEKENKILNRKFNIFDVDLLEY